MKSRPPVLVWESKYTKMEMFLANSKAIEWMHEHASEYASGNTRYPVSDLAHKAAYLFAEEYGLGWNGDYISYLYYHQTAEIFKELNLNPAENDIVHEANYSAGCKRYH